MPLNLTDAPQLAAALLRLRGETLAQLSRATNIKPANLSVWMRGAQQVISERRVVMLLNELGVQGGQLRSDIVHHWRDTGDLADLRYVLSLLVSDPEAKQSIVYQELPSGFEMVVLLQIETLRQPAIVFVKTEPSLTERGLVTAAILSFGADKKVSHLAGLADATPEQIVLALHPSAPQYFVEDDVIEPFESNHDVFLHDARCEPPSFAQPPVSTELQHAVDRALQSGISMGEIIAAVRRLY